MSDQAIRHLLEFLDVQSSAPPAAAARASAEATEAPEATDLETIRALRETLLANPEAVLAEAPAILGNDPDLASALELLNDAEAALRTPRATLASLALNRSDDTYELPEKYHFPGYDPEGIPIRPAEKKFESAADASAWLVTATAAWWFRLKTQKPTLPQSAGTAEYPLEARDGATTVALFSDWATGYYHSKYIARHIVHLEAAQAVHLGDVYYTGTAAQFQKYFTPILDPVLRAMPFYALNANHEMDSHGIPYLEFLARKRALGGALGYAPQPQETSYFCLSNEQYQVIGIDTAFYKNGRHKEPTLQRWLEDRLDSGRDADKTTILLSQNEPYGPKRFGGSTVAAREVRPLYEKDLGRFAQKGLVHAWFWGDEHFAALYEPNDSFPFVGSCIGHGGYPYGKMEQPTPSTKDLARVSWVETEPRFPRDTNQRLDRGNNGFCVLTLEEAGILVTYWDWLRRSRKVVRLVREGARLRIVQVSQPDGA